MGDRTAMTLRLDVGDLTAEQTEAALEAFFEYGPDSDQVSKGLGVYVWTEVTCGTVQDAADSLAEHLAEAGLERPFDAWQDPYYEFPGWLMRHEPGEPIAAFDCNTEGSIILTAEQAQALRKENTGDAELLGAIWAALGLGDPA